MLDWNVKDVVTMGTATVGAVLGFVNFVQSLRQRQVRLKVTPKVFTIKQGGFLYSSDQVVPHSLPCITVVNLSGFEVTIREVGFELKADSRRAVLIPDSNRPVLPCRLKAREAVTIHAGERFVMPRNAKKAYATTECDETRRGDSPAWRELRKSFKQL